MLIITPIVTRHFGLELMGIWLLVSQYAQHLMLLELGINTSLTRFLARHRGCDDLRGASQYLSASIFSLITMGGLVILVTPLLASGFQAAFQLPPETGPEVYWLVLLASLTTGLSLPLRTGIGMLSSSHRFHRLALWQTLVLCARLILVLICFFWFDPDLLLMGLITFVPSLLGNLMVFRDGRQENRDLRISHRLLAKRVIWRMFSVSSAAIVITLSAVVVRQSSSMLVGFGLGSNHVAVLAFPILIVSSVMPFVGVINRMIAPVASQLTAHEKQGALYKVSTMAGSYVFALSLLILIGFHYIGYLLLDLWLGGPKVGDEALHQMAEILVVVFAGFTLATPGFIVRSVLVAVGRHWHAAGAEMIGSFLGVALGLWLMMGTELGVMGMAIGIFIAFVVRGAGFLAIRGAQYFSVSYLLLMGSSMGKPLGVAALSTLISETLVQCIPQDAGGWVSGCMPFVAAAAVWSVGVWLWILDPEHKQKVLAGLRSRLMKNNR